MRAADTKIKVAYSLLCDKSGACLMSVPTMSVQQKRRAWLWEVQILLDVTTPAAQSRRGRKELQLLRKYLQKPLPPPFFTLTWARLLPPGCQTLMPPPAWSVPLASPSPRDGIIVGPVERLGTKSVLMRDCWHRSLPHWETNRRWDRGATDKRLIDLLIDGLIFHFQGFKFGVGVWYIFQSIFVDLVCKFFFFFLRKIDVVMITVLIIVITMDW